MYVKKIPVNFSPDRSFLKNGPVPESVRLRHAGSAAKQKGFSGAHSSLPQGNGNCRAFGKILYAYAQREGQRGNKKRLVFLMLRGQRE
jgi:hypothetical protein